MTTAVELSPLAVQRFTDSAGVPLVGGKLFTYQAGTSTKTPTYTDASGSTPNTNPVVLNSRGEAQVWLAQGQAYKFVLAPATDTDPPASPIWTVDNVMPALSQLAQAAGAALVGFQQSGGGAAARNVQAKLRDAVSVADFGAVGDGVTDDTTAIQNAVNTGKAVYFPIPSAFYKTTAAITVGYSPRLYGERGVATIIRRVSGAGGVFDFAATNENAVIEHLRIGGGATAVGLTVAGGGYANYLSTLSLRNVHFEVDLLQGINANLIHSDFIDCTFGYFQQSSANANFQAVVSSFAGGSNTNINNVTNCKFFNGGTTQAAVSFTSGLVLSFMSCAWENNGRDMQTSNVQNLTLIDCYSERGKHATSQFDFGASRTRSKVVGGQFNGSSMPAGASMFRAPETGALMVEDADISTSASAFAYQDANNTAHSLPTSGVHQFRNCRIQGNAADPLLWMDNVIEDTAVAWTPVPNGLTVVNGTGGATYSGTWSIRNRMVTLTLRIVTTGTCTTACVAGTTFFQLPANLPNPAVSAAVPAVNEVSNASLGVGMAYAGNGRLYPPAWSAAAGSVSMSVVYPI